MNSNVKSVISKCEKNNNGEVFLSLKPRIDDLDTTVAHLYSAGGKMCYFNMPKGNGFHIWDKEYEKYTFNEMEFASEKGFNYLFNNWDNMIKTCSNRALGEYYFKVGKDSSEKPVTHYERMRENMIAAYNDELSEELLAVIDMEYSVDKKKLGNKNIMKNPKADLICATVEKDKIVFYITEYKSTENGFGVSLKEHYDDMAMYYDDIRIKKHLIKTLQERLKYGLIVCNKKIANIINDLTVDNIDVKLLFLFSNSADYREKKKNVLSRGYSYIFEKSKSDGISVEYAYINKIESGCLKKAILRDFEKEGMFELI